MTEAERIAGDLVAALAEAWNTKDAKAWGAPFAEDAEFTNVLGMTQVGRQAIEDNHRLIFQTFFKDSRVIATEIQARFIREGVLAARVWWEMTGARGPQGQEIPLRRTLMTLIATARDGQWGVDVVHNMDVPGDGYARPMTELVKAWKRDGGDR